MRSATAARRARTLVLGVGNRLLRDDGVGLALLDALASDLGDLPDVECIDGGTQGLALLALLDQRTSVLVLDAVAMGALPGTVHDFEIPTAGMAPRSGTAHESSVSELLAVATLLGERPPRLWMVGVEPEVVRTGIGLSAAVERAVPLAMRVARDRLFQWGVVSGAEVARA